MLCPIFYHRKSISSLAPFHVDDTRGAEEAKKSEHVSLRGTASDEHGWLISNSKQLAVTWIWAVGEKFSFFSEAFMLARLKMPTFEWPPRETVSSEIGRQFEVKTLADGLGSKSNRRFSTCKWRQFSFMAASRLKLNIGSDYLT